MPKLSPAANLSLSSSVSIGDDSPAEELRAAYVSDFPSFGINIGDHQNAIEVHTSAEHRYQIIRALKIADAIAIISAVVLAGGSIKTL